MGVPQVAAAIFAYGLGKIAQSLLEPEPETPLVDEKPTTRSTRGSFIPTLIGTRKVGAIIAWTGNRTVIREEDSSGGKGFAGGSVEQDTYFEDAIHVLAIGPASKLSKIWVNGSRVKFNNNVPITPTTHPSGSTLDVTKGGETVGQFEIYWGEPDQEIDLFAGTAIGINSRWPFMCRVNWRSFRLGGFAVWPTIEYELEVRPYGTTLSSTSNWMENGLGPAENPYTILGVNNSSDVGGIDPPYFKIWGGGSDKTSEFPAGGYAVVTGQLEPLVNRIWLIEGSSYDSGETYLETTGNFASVPDSAVQEDLTSWDETNASKVSTSVFSGLPNTDYPTGFTQSNGDIYELVVTGTNIATQGIYFNTTDAGDAEDRFSTGAQRLVFWIKGLHSNQGWVSGVFIGFGAGPSGVPSTDLTYVRFQALNDIYTNTDFEGAVGTIQDAGNDWARITVTFRTGDDNDGSITSADRRQVFIKLPEPGVGTSKIRIFQNEDAPSNNFLKEDDGTLRTGITTIYLDETLSGAVSDRGTIDALVEGNGADGANPAHTLEQLLFGTFPHGAALDPTYWDLDSLDALGVTAEAEGARTHILADLGKDIKSIIGIILQDLHAYIAWDRVNGKYVFGLIRDESENVVPEIPIDLLTHPAPNRKQLQATRVPAQVTFGFANRDFAYRDDTRPIDDDAIAGIYNNRTVENIKIPTATDFFYAEKVAERRQLEILVPPHAYKISALRESKLLTPGRSITIEGVDEPIRITSSEYDPDTGKTEIEGLTDTYSLSESFAGPPGMPEFNGGGGPPAAQADLYNAIWELPPFLAQEAVSIMVTRLRAHQGVTSASVYISDDDISYTKIASKVPYCSGGILLTDISTNHSTYQDNELKAPIISAVGDDILAVSQTLSDKQWLAGRQLCLIGNEVFYLRQLRAMGGGSYKLDGLVRARLGTAVEAHNVDDPVFIFPATNVFRLRDRLIAPGQTLYVKVVPQGMTLADVTSFSQTIEGRGIRPLAPTGLITRTARNCYKTGENIDLRWSYYDITSFGTRNGTGFQNAGEPLEENVEPTGYFRLKFYDGTVLLRTEEVTTNSYRYLNSDIVSDAGGEPDIYVELEHIYNGYRSDKTTLTVVSL